MKNAIIAANWKMNKGPREARAFMESLRAQSWPSERTLILFPSAPCLEAVADGIRGKSVEFGAQNCFSALEGAFTGEVSPQVIKDLGGQWCLLGHSERRTLFGETDEMIAKKAVFVASLGLRPMICVGETLAEREGGRTSEILRSQLLTALSKFSSPEPKLVIAYEPVWAIGTGRVATEAQVEEAHQFLLKTLSDKAWPRLPILYGGSVKPENAEALLSLSGVSGFLIGGASLDVSSLMKIANC